MQEEERKGIEMDTSLLGTNEEKTVLAKEAWRLTSSEKIMRPDTEKKSLGKWPKVLPSILMAVVAVTLASRMRFSLEGRHLSYLLAHLLLITNVSEKVKFWEFLSDWGRTWTQVSWVKCAPSLSSPGVSFRRVPWGKSEATVDREDRGKAKGEQESNICLKSHMVKKG